MRTFILSLPLFIIITFCALAFGETYAVTKDDGSVAIVNYFPGSTDTLSDVLEEVGLDGRPIIQISEVPEGPMEYWKVAGKRVVIDQNKKQAIENQKQAKEERKRQLLKMTEDEFAEAKTLGLVR